MVYDVWGDKAKYVEKITKAKGFDEFLKMGYYEMLTSYKGLPLEAYFGLIEDVFKTEKAKNIMEVYEGLNTTHIQIIATELLREKTGRGIGNELLMKVLREAERVGLLKSWRKRNAKVYVLNKYEEIRKELEKVFKD